MSGKKTMTVISLFLARLIIATVVIALFFVLTQDFQIMPSFTSSLFTKSERDPASLPAGIKSTFVNTPDNKRIEVWSLSADDDPEKRPQVVLFLHGNGDTNESGYFVMRAFQKLGFTTYSFDYRGSGRSTGWPSEKGIYTDSETVWSFMLEQEDIDARDVIILGSSLGTGPGSYLASKFNPKVLILLSPNTSIPDVVRGMPGLRYLARFLWWELPTKRYVSELENTCVIAAHGKRDTVIPYHHSPIIEKAYSGQKQFHMITSEKAGHNDLLAHTFETIVGRLEDCLQEH